ncbi:hypothetical protein SDC9_85537 [bioreactor metagenome]|uniref:Putative conjugal transfer nickase/helicase TraI C-terminal domain-containing protein n=1 Tax=bioreactor metagenome TaxID=1076179 RepID=A0A644ZDF9_9ZZZZ
MIETVSVDQEPEAPRPLPTADAKATPASQEAPPWEDAGSIASAPSSKPQATPDAMEDMLALVGGGDAPATPLDTEAAPREAPATHHEVPVPPSAAALPSPVALKAIPSTSQPSGEHFMEWLNQGIASRRLIINDAKALVHTVSDTAYLVSPGVFQRYAQEHPQVGTLAKQENQQDWQWVQKRFERLQLHRKQPGGLNIWTCEVTGPRKSRRLHGYLLQEPSDLLNECPPDNPYLSLQR